MTELESSKQSTYQSFEELGTKYFDLPDVVELNNNPIMMGKRHHDGGDEMGRCHDNESSYSRTL